MLIFRTSLYLDALLTQVRYTHSFCIERRGREKEKKKKKKKAISNCRFEPIVSLLVDDISDERAKREIKWEKMKKNSRCNLDDSPRLYPRWSTLTYSGRRTVNIFGANFFRKGLLALREGCELVYALLSASTCVSFELHDYWPKALSAEERIICRCSTRTVRSRCSPLH